MSTKFRNHWVNFRRTLLRNSLQNVREFFGENPDASAYENRSTVHANLLAFLGVFLGCTLFISNILAAKIWCLGPFTFDGGLILFPLTYVLGDILAEVYGKKTANRIAIYCTISNIIGFSTFIIVDMLPAAPDMENVASFSIALHLSLRITLASMVGFIASSFINNHIVELLKACTKQNEIGTRAWASSLCARAADTLLFSTIAFYGRMEPLAFLKHMAYAMAAGTIVETVLIKLLTVRCCRFFKHVLRQC